MQVEKVSTSREEEGDSIAPSHALWEKPKQEKASDSNKEHCSDITKQQTQQQLLKKKVGDLDHHVRVFVDCHCEDIS